MKNLLFVFTICCLAVACEKESASELLPIDSRSSYVIQVSGEISEQGLNSNLGPNGLSYTGVDTWTGDLTGDGHAHIYSSEGSDPENQQNIISKKWLHTSEGNLIFDEVGSQNGNVVTVISTVSKGTGIYKNATGQLTMNGILVDGGVQFTYNGSLTLVD